MADANPPIRGKKPKKRAVKPEVKDKILERVAREEKALRIVERLIDNPVSSQLLQKSLRYINQSVYNDIVEERSIEKHCGYPICKNQLPKIIKKQTYAINARLNKVYKLEERNKFCSSKCYTYSRNIRDQLLSEPVWLVSKSAHADIEMTPLEVEETDDEELPKNQKIDDKHLHEEEEVRKHVIIREHANLKQDISTKPSLAVVKSTKNVVESVENQFSWLNLEEDDSLSEDETDRINHIPDLSFIESIKHCLTQWRTSQSSSFLSGTQSAVPSPDEVEVDDFEEDLLDDDLRISNIENKAPMPDISELKSESIEVKESSVPRQPDPVVHLPKVDSVNQVQLRQSIVVSKLQPAIDRILCKTNFSYGDMSAVIIKLVSFLNISSVNCMFTEKQSVVISAITLSLAYPLLPAFHCSFSQNQFDKYLIKQANELIPRDSEFYELCDIFR